MAPPDLPIFRLQETLRAAGLRATRARMSVLSVLRRAQRPATHDEVMDHLGGVFDGATVYRVLADLVAAQLVRRMDLGDKIWRYELAGAHPQGGADHPHFICDVCRAVLCLPPLELRTREGLPLQALSGAVLTFQLSGTCAACLAG
jgi:Fur family ferric uptake transcriptional regulator